MSPLVIYLDTDMLDALPSSSGHWPGSSYTELDAAVDRMLTLQCHNCHMPIHRMFGGGQCPTCARWHDGYTWGKGHGADSPSPPIRPG